jgi:hypothetical protein
MEWGPAVSEEVEKVAMPPLKAPTPTLAPPSSKVTLPVGVPPEAVTVAVKVTD